MSKLVLIICSPHTGSSLVAQIFWRHGCWLDNETSSKVSRYGYVTYESQKIKPVVNQQVKRYNKGKTKYGKLMTPSEKQLEAVTQIVNKVVPDVDYWLHKIARPEQSSFFLQFDPKIILVKRDEDQTVLSKINKRKVSSRSTNNEKEIRATYKKQLALMNDIQKEHGGKWVDVDEIVNGEYRSVQHAIEYCGLDFNQSYVSQSLDPEKWHHKRE